MSPSEIRVIVLDTTGPVAGLAVENWQRRDALAFHGLPETKKPRQRTLTGRKSKSYGGNVRVSGVSAG